MFKYIFFIFKKVIGVFILFFLYSNFAFAASVDVGDDVNLLLPIENDLNLSASVTGVDLCDFIEYMWVDESERLFIEMPYDKDMAKIYSSDLNSNPGEYTIKLTVICNGGSPDDSGFIEEDSFVLTLGGGSPNESPTDISLDKNDVNENSSIGTTIGSLSTTDLDDTSHSYSLVNTVSYPDNIKFSISGNDLKLAFEPDYETKNSYSITIQTEDSEGETYQKEFTININDLDESVGSIFAGNNQNVNFGDKVFLNGIKSGFPETGCDFTYSWEESSEKVFISNPGLLTGASFKTDSFTSDTTLKISLTMNVSSSAMTHDSCGKTGEYMDDLNVNITEAEVLPPGGGRSNYQKALDEANRIFESEESIGKIKLTISEKKAGKSLYYVGWNNIGWGGHIKYELLYSTGSNFDNSRTFETTSNSKMFFEKELGENEDIYFFKVRAFYNDKYSTRSNILSLTNKKFFLRLFNVKCRGCEKQIGYMDVFKSLDLLIEKEFQINCSGICDTRVKFSDIWESKELLLEKFQIECKTCNSKVKFENPYIKYGNVKRVNFSELVK